MPNTEVDYGLDREAVRSIARLQNKKADDKAHHRSGTERDRGASGYEASSPYARAFS